VRISASALVAAATLAPLYHRSLPPDKAIDLMDEAYSRLRMEVDSKPEEPDALGRQIPCNPDRVKKPSRWVEDDQASKDRPGDIAEGIWRASRERSDAMTAAWQAERDKPAGARDIKEKSTSPRRSGYKGQSGQGGGVVCGVIPTWSGNRWTPRAARTG
jgi:ATP-dependent Clp protease ATP-binding subunit ClpB